MNNKHFEEYQSPICEQFDLVLEGAVMSASGTDQDQLVRFENNTIFGEDF